MNNMNYLNQFKPDSGLIEEISNINEFKSLIQTTTFIQERFKDKSVDYYKVFDPDKVVLEEPAVFIEFEGFQNEPVFELFRAVQVPGSDKTEFTAAEMFYNILKFETKLNGSPAFFKSISYQGVAKEEKDGRDIPVFKVEFGLD